MTKTKVKTSPTLLSYCQEMAQIVNDVRDEKLRIAEGVEHDVEPFAHQMELQGSDKAGLLMPPRIEILLPEFYLMEGGEIEGIINITTSDYFGISSLGVATRDETGNLLESGEALRDETWLGLWTYLPKIAPAVNTSMIVRVVASDVLGGLSKAEVRVILTEEYLRTSSAQFESRE